MSLPRAPMPLLLALLAFTVLVGRAMQSAAQETVTLESLLKEMIDRDHLARFPSPAYTCRQASSYDRDTVAPDQPGWFANWDRSQFIRVEENAGRREHVMLDVEGPGAVVRIWGTWHGPRGGPFSNGTMRVYLDQSPQPAIEGPIADLISGGALVPPPLSDSVSPESPYERRGHNLYLPIPYAKHCKITYESDKVVDVGGKQGEALYYQINYRTYEPSTKVGSFARRQLQGLLPLVNEVGARLLHSGVANVDQLQANDVSVRLPPGDEQSLSLDGPAAIRQVTCRLVAEDLPQALRSTVAQIEFDGERTAWCPLGDFFGTGHRLCPYQTWYTKVAEDGTMKAFWVMPFQKSCTISVRNLGDQEVELADAVVHTGPWSWDDRSLHFHAAWRQYTKVETGPNKDQAAKGAFDVNYVEVSGKGQYVGDTLTVFNGIAAWWGEGDEKIFLDGESFPSHIGTGTEDYYGYAWCRPEFFQAPFHAQPTGSGNLTSGLTVNNRYRSLDALPFAKSIKFDMELWHWRSTLVNYAPTTFWYARPGAKSNVGPDPATAALPVPRKRSDIVDVVEVPGAIEGEELKIVEKTGGKTQVQASETWQWSGDQQLWWIDAKPGDRLVLEFPSESAGTHRVIADLTKAKDYGIVRLSINGRPVENSIDRYATEVSHEPVELGRFPLNRGANRLEIEIVGANEQAIKRHMFGLDYLKLEKAE